MAACGKEKHWVCSEFLFQLCHQAQCGLGQVASLSFYFPSGRENVTHQPAGQGPVFWAAPPKAWHIPGAELGGCLSEAALAVTGEAAPAPASHSRGFLVPESGPACPCDGARLSHPKPGEAEEEARGTGPSLIPVAPDCLSAFSERSRFFSLRLRDWARRSHAAAERSCASSFRGHTL